MKPTDLSSINDFRDHVAANAKAKGFREQMFKGLSPEQTDGPVGEKTAIMTFCENLHGEVSELWEAYRAGNLHALCDKAEKMVAMGLPPLTCAEEELADIIIRALDTAEHYKIDVAKALATKAEYNSSRPILHGGKLA
jgi:NTP pyrophosphatase (non-canonical NTP hydrolase)